MTPHREVHVRGGNHGCRTPLPWHPSHRTRKSTRLLPHGNTHCRCWRVLPHHALDRNGRTLSTVLRGRPPERFRRQHPGRRSRGRARGPGRSYCTFSVWQTGGEFHVRTGNPVRRGAVL